MTMMTTMTPRNAQTPKFRRLNTLYREMPAKHKLREEEEERRRGGGEGEKSRGGELEEDEKKMDKK